MKKTEDTQHTLDRRIHRELKTVRTMIAIYCQGQRHPAPPGQLCPACSELWDYTQRRVERCPFASDKPTCVNCTVHCFKRDQRERIREVMRYAGPRMPLRHPVLTIFHLFDGRRPTPQKKR